eukprot:scaffold297062_cov34-Prasinocladus_malaysianus.AAC.1
MATAAPLPQCSADDSRSMLSKTIGSFSTAAYRRILVRDSDRCCSHTSSEPTYQQGRDRVLAIKRCGRSIIFDSARAHRRRRFPVGAIQCTGKWIPAEAGGERSLGSEPKCDRLGLAGQTSDFQRPA